jgi:hypothetical protein
MKNAMLPIVILLALGTSAPAADPADAQWEKMNAVMYAAQRDRVVQLERLKSLIDEGADVNAAIGFDRLLRVGETRADLTGTKWPLDVAVEQARVDMVKLLLAKGAKFHGGELAHAALKGNQDESLAMITALIEAGADVNSRYDYGFTALIGATYKGNTNAVKLLLAEPGINVDQTNEDGEAALMVAAEHGHAEIVDMLLKAGTDVSDTAITRAQKHHTELMATLAKQQAIISKLQSAQAETPKEAPVKKESPASPVATKKDEKPPHVVEKPDKKARVDTFARYLPIKVVGELTKETLVEPNMLFISRMPPSTHADVRFRDLIDPRYLKKHGLTDRDIAFEFADNQGRENIVVADDLQTVLCITNLGGGKKEAIILRWVVYEGHLYISPEQAPDPKTGIFKPWILRTKVN